MKVKVKHITLQADTHKDLLERLEGVMETYRNTGYRILAVMPDPMPI